MCVCLSVWRRERRCRWPMGILLLGQLPFPLMFVAWVDLLVAVASPGWDAACMKGMTEEVRLPKILG